MLGPGSVELTGENVGSGSGLTTPGMRRTGLPTPVLQAHDKALYSNASGKQPYVSILALH